MLVHSQSIAPWLFAGFHLLAWWSIRGPRQADTFQGWNFSVAKTESFFRAALQSDLGQFFTL